MCPKTKKDLFKFWWSQELDCLKTQAIESNKLWQNAGRPRSGPIYCKRNSDKRAYRLAIRRAQADINERYSNDLHELLLYKEGSEFWRCWKAKFDTKTGTSVKVDGHLDHNLIVESFIKHFRIICTAEKTKESLNLQATYESTVVEKIILVHHLPTVICLTRNKLNVSCAICIAVKLLALTACLQNI